MAPPQVGPALVAVLLLSRPAWLKLRSWYLASSQLPLP